MEYGIRLNSIAILVCALPGQSAWPEVPQIDAITRTMAHDVFKQLLEINTTDSLGSTTTAAQAMAGRLLDAGFPADDVMADAGMPSYGIGGIAGGAPRHSAGNP